MKMLRSKGGFTLVEIMIVVAIIGLLAAIAIPNFVRTRERAQAQACVANMRQLQGAKTLWALDNNEPNDATPSIGTTDAPGDLVPDYIQRAPQCPAGGDYTPGTVVGLVTCSEGGDHDLSEHM